MSSIAKKISGRVVQTIFTAFLLTATYHAYGQAQPEVKPHTTIVHVSNAKEKQLQHKIQHDQHERILEQQHKIQHDQHEKALEQQHDLQHDQHEAMLKQQHDLLHKQHELALQEKHQQAVKKKNQKK